MSACVCDYERPEFYHATRPLARTAHRCDECGRTIEPGERYERVYAKWDGDPGTVRTCCYRLAMRDLLESRECFCWMHHSLSDDVLEEIREGDWKRPGARFAALRLLSAHPRVQEWRGRRVRP